MAATSLRVDSPQPAGMQPRQVLEFFVALPLVVGLFMGAARIGGYQFATVGHHMAYTALYSVLSWICYGIAAKAAAVLLRPWAPPLLLVLVVGNVAGGLALLWPARDVLNTFFVHSLLPGSTFGSFWPPPADRLGGYIAFTLQGMAWWVIANWLDFRYRQVPRFGFVPAAPTTTATGEATIPARIGASDVASPAPASPATSAGHRPRLVDRLPERLRGAAILALEAEEHYTKVRTDAGSTLLLLRFSDAIVEMEPQPGLQVHRSFWVARDAVERVARSERRLVVRLRGGLEVPVSRSFRLAVRSAGLPGSATATD